MSASWFKVQDEADIPTPALLFYHDRIEHNLQLLLSIAGGPERLRPHIKTHKCPELIRAQLRLGIKKFKCATIAEAEMAAAEGAPDILLAYQPVGPNLQRFLALVQTFPESRFSTIADNRRTIELLSGAFSGAGKSVDVLVDIDCGMGRCGAPPTEVAASLYALIASSPGLRPGGLHVYDGHIHQKNLDERTRACAEAFIPVERLLATLAARELAVPRIVAGGTPTFPIHARNTHVDCSPGTCVLWDFGYRDNFPDMPFHPAAVVLTRVISKPGDQKICLDLGHKAIASENPQPRVEFPELPGAVPVTHSEEHLVLQTPFAEKFQEGDCFYGIPRHVCPTVNLYSEAVVIKNGAATDRWKILGGERRLTV